MTSLRVKLSEDELAFRRIISMGNAWNVTYTKINIEQADAVETFVDFLCTIFEYPRQKKEQTIEEYIHYVIEEGCKKFLGSDEETKIKAARFEQELLKKWKGE